ncbi:AsmA family protein [Thiohalorhabdus methylotrophus]|uniref:AsmA family protein n=1 Tax=Thiohalorhabdus methylotrophus TaxID=3242694 RepID=A0ABV4TWB0_9GAMM
MKRVRRFLLAGLAGVAALLLVAAVAVSWLVDASAYRGDLEALASRHFGRPVEIQGVMRLDLLPWPGLEMQEVRLADAPGFGPQPLARVARIHGPIRLLPLLRGRVRLGAVSLEGLAVHLVGGRSGRGNWSPAKEGGSGGSPLAGVVGLAHGGLRVNDGKVIWEDRKAGRRLALKNLRLESGALAPGRRVPLALSADLRGRDSIPRGTVELTTALIGRPQEREYRARDLEADLSLRGRHLPGERIDGRLRVREILADLDAGRFRAGRVLLDALGLRMTGEAEGGRASGGTDWSGHWKAEVRDPGRAAAVLARLSLPRLPPGALERSYLRAGFRYSGASQSASLTDVRGSVAGLHVQGRLEGRSPLSDPALEGRLSLRVDHGRKVAGWLLRGAPEGFRAGGLEGGRVSARIAFGGAPQGLTLAGLEGRLGGLLFTGRAHSPDLRTYSGRLETAEFDPRSLANRLGLPLPPRSDPGVLRRAELAATFSGGSARIAFPQLHATLDRSRLTGGLLLVAGARQPRIGFDFHVNGLDLDAYLPRLQSAAPWPAGVAAAILTEVPVRTLRGLTLGGRLRVDGLRAGGVRMERLRASLHAARGRLRVESMHARLYRGRYRGRLQGDVTGRKPRLALQERISGVQVGPLQRDVAGKVLVDGVARLDLDLEARGRTPAEMVRTLEGTGGYLLREGNLVGLDLIERVRSYLSPLGGSGPAGGGAGTRFRSLQGTLEVRDGRIHSRDLKAMAALFRADGSGYVDLPEGHLDYALDLALRGKDEALPALLNGLVIPLRLHGPLADPRVDVQLGDMLGVGLDSGGTGPGDS